MDVKQKFLDLTSQTYPHGHEKELLSILPEYLTEDKHGNYYHQIGENPSTMFTCHLDTASSKKSIVNHVINGTIIQTDGSSILGADDKAGVVVLLYMMEHNISGLYYFFIGEERGCVGSRSLSSEHSKQPIESIKKVISFDRRGTDSVITHQLGGRCCSETFGKELSRELNNAERDFNYKNDNTGIYTDSAQFTEIYPECTNISVGYNYEHSSSEFQDIEHLEKLCKATVKINWENLPIERNPKINSYYDDEFDEDDYYDKNYNTLQYKEETKTHSNDYRSTYYFIDPIYNEKSSVTIKGNSNKILEMELCDDRLDYELDKIEELFHTFAVEYQNLEWNGVQLIIDYNESQNSIMYRDELLEYIEEFNFWVGEIG